MNDIKFIIVKNRTYKLHDQIFAGLSRLSCYVCGKEFSRSDGLKTHIRDIHENAGKTFHCELCNKPSKSLNALKVHMSTYHRSGASAITVPVHFLGAIGTPSITD